MTNQNNGRFIEFSSEYNSLICFCRLINQIGKSLVKRIHIEFKSTGKAYPDKANQLYLCCFFLSTPFLHLLLLSLIHLSNIIS